MYDCSTQVSKLVLKGKKVRKGEKALSHLKPETSLYWYSAWRWGTNR